MLFVTKLEEIRSWYRYTEIASITKISMKIQALPSARFEEVLTLLVLF